MNNPSDHTHTDAASCRICAKMGIRSSAARAKFQAGEPQTSLDISVIHWRIGHDLPLTAEQRELAVKVGWL